MPELQAAAVALRRLPASLRRKYNAALREQGNTIWRGEVASHIRTPADQRILGKGVRITPGNPPVAIAANSRRPVGRSRRLVPSDVWAGYEYGSNRESFSRYQRRSSRGKMHTVTRRTMRHLPPRVRSGRVLGPAFAESAPRIMALATKLLVRVVMDAAEGKD